MACTSMCTQFRGSKRRYWDFPRCKNSNLFNPLAMISVFYPLKQLVANNNSTCVAFNVRRINLKRDKICGLRVPWHAKRFLRRSVWFLWTLMKIMTMEGEEEVKGREENSDDKHFTMTFSAKALSSFAKSLFAPTLLSGSLSLCVYANLISMRHWNHFITVVCTLLCLSTWEAREKLSSDAKTRRRGIRRTQQHKFQWKVGAGKSS